MKLITILCLFFFAQTEAKDVYCPDGAMKCPDWGTCCENADTSYGCCPFKNAECCPDFIHCCAQGTHCNVKNRSCDSNKVSSKSFQWLVPHYHPNSVSAAFEEPNISITKLETSEHNVTTNEEDVCPDGRSCEEEETCCLIGENQFGCCPYSHAQCCKDKVHCCPEGYDCDLSHERCNKRSQSNSIANTKNFPIFNMKKNTFYVSRYEENVCPDGRSCQEGATCCSIGGGKWGCCPYRKARCCKDKVHCCPDGYDCDLSHNQCLKNGSSNSATSPEDILPIFNIEKNKFELPIEKDLCGPSNLCFLSGEVCCSYGKVVTCCPKGSTCLPEGKGCKRDVSEISGYFFFKSLANLKDVNPKVDAICPDKTESCPNDNTCCLMTSGMYGCCPLPDATCCPDRLTCCPQGYECAGDNTCERRPFFHLLNLPIFAQRKPYKNL